MPIGPKSVKNPIHELAAIGYWGRRTAPSRCRASGTFRRTVTCGSEARVRNFWTGAAVAVLLGVAVGGWQTFGGGEPESPLAAAAGPEAAASQVPTPAPPPSETTTS